MKTLLILLTLLAAFAPSSAGANEPASAAAEKLAAPYSYATLPPASQPAGQTGDGEEAAPDPPAREALADRREEREFRYKALLALSITSILLYLAAAGVMFRMSPRPKGQQVVHLTSLSLIVYGCLALVLITTTHEALTAPIGILGALAGYLFGHSSTTKPAQAEGDGA